LELGAGCDTKEASGRLDILEDNHEALSAGASAAILATVHNGGSVVASIHDDFNP